MARHHAGWWGERVAELAEGNDVAVVARRHGVSVRLLKWWRWKLGSEARIATASASTKIRSPGRLQRLLPVVIAPAVVPGSHVDDVTTIIETSRGRVTMRGQLSAEQLAAVVAELVRG